MRKVAYSRPVMSAVASLLALAMPQLATAASASQSGAAKANITITSQVERGDQGRLSTGNTFRVRAAVPMACWVRPDRTLNASTGLSGEVVEACNNPGGFTVTASYRPLQASEKAELFYDNRPINLALAGQQVLFHSSQANVRSVNYRFGEVEIDSPLTLSLVIQPL